MEDPREQYHAARQAYAAISHTLTLEQRQHFRRHIAQLHAVARDYFRTPAFVRAAASLAMARAGHAAQIMTTSLVHKRSGLRLK